MSNNRSRTDTIILVLLLISVIAIYITSFYTVNIKAIGFNDFVSTVRFLVDRTWQAFIFGSLLSIFLEMIFPHRLRSYLLAGSGLKPIFNSLWIGIFSNKCVYETLNSGISLYKSGVSLGASISYLISAPIMNPLSISLFISLFGYKVSFNLILIILISAFIIGVLFDLLVSLKILQKQPIISRINPFYPFKSELWSYIINIKEKCINSRSIKSSIYYYFFRWITFLRLNTKWILLSIVLSGLFAGGFEESQLHTIFGNNIIAFISILVLASVIELHVLGAIIFAFFFYHMTGALGNVILFIVGMYVIEYFEIGSIKRDLGWKVYLYFAIYTFFFLSFITYIIN